MFTGIIKAIARVSQFEEKQGVWRLSLTCPGEFLVEVEIGASIAIDGACLTVVAFTDDTVAFDVIQETYQRTTMQYLSVGNDVNCERAARFGDEIGGHMLSGHILTTAEIVEIDKTDDQYIVYMQIGSEWMPYIFSKGYIALNGASLTIVDVDTSTATFNVHLIPETLQKTTFSEKSVGDRINVEIDSQTQVIVDTMQRCLVNQKGD